MHFSTNVCGTLHDNNVKSPNLEIFGFDVAGRRSYAPAIRPKIKIFNIYLNIFLGSTMLERVACMFDVLCSTCFVGRMS